MNAIPQEYEACRQDALLLIEALGQCTNYPAERHSDDLSQLDSNTPSVLNSMLYDVFHHKTGAMYGSALRLDGEDVAPKMSTDYGRVSAAALQARRSRKNVGCISAEPRFVEASKDPDLMKRIFVRDGEIVGFQKGNYERTVIAFEDIIFRTKNGSGLLVLKGALFEEFAPGQGAVVDVDAVVTEHVLVIRGTSFVLPRYNSGRLIKNKRIKFGKDKLEEVRARVQEAYIRGKIRA